MESPNRPVEPPSPKSSAAWRSGRRPWLNLTPQAWTAGLSAVLLVAMAMIISFVPVPFVVRQPGEAWDLGGRDPASKAPVIEVTGGQTFPNSGRLYLLTVSESRPDWPVTLPEALLAHWARRQDAIPRDVVYPPGKSDAEVRKEDEVMMDGSKENAVVAALRAAHQPVEEVPRVAKVNTSGPAHQKLRPGDILLKVDGAPVRTPEDISAAIAKHNVGDPVAFTVARGGSESVVQVIAVGSNQNPRDPRVGIGVDVGYRHAMDATFHVDPEIGGPSGGLMFALGTYDKVTPGDLLAGRSVAGTGEISPTGEVGRIGGIQQKLGAAMKENAEVFLVPAANCSDLAGVATSLRLVKVATLDDAITALQKLSGPHAKEVPSC